MRKLLISLTTAFAVSGYALMTAYAQQPSSHGGASPMSLPPAMSRNPPPPGGPHPFVPSPSMAVALRIAHAAVGACHGFHIGVTVLDAAGYPKLTYIPDGSHGFHAFISFRKANTALKFRIPSGQISAAMKSDPRVAAEYQADAGDYITFAGGLPLFKGHELIGALGVSGAEPSAQDEACAKSAARSVRLEY